ncbi:MAG: DUF3048 domain-containing protein [Clostridia bacterium]|nr:DUF3048 domain-containing protein [Clostridia bacterium]
MKKLSFLVALLLVFGIFIFAGCAKNEDALSNESTELTTEAIPLPDPEELEISSFFETYINTNNRPIAIMVDNDNDDARPHAGLNEAYLIYEMVVEGGATRFVAFYRTDTEKIGPVRSSRHYFLDYVMENDAIYTHYGWSPQAIKDISAFGINKINGVLGGDGEIFWREQKFKGDWHSAYTSIKNIKEMSEKKGFSLNSDHKNGLKYAQKYFDLENENIANEIYLPYSGMYKTGYTYNPETKLYEKTINSMPHVMQNGETMTVKNIIIELIYDTSLGDGTDRRNVNTTGSGEGYFITNGKYEKITWSKPSRRANTVYKDANGQEIKINPGKTIVNIISPSAGITIQ